jgi:hypothetical protein
VGYTEILEYHEKFKISLAVLQEILSGNWQYWSNFHVLPTPSSRLYNIFRYGSSSGYEQLFWGFRHGRKVGVHYRSQSDWPNCKSARRQFRCVCWFLLGTNFSSNNNAQTTLRCIGNTAIHNTQWRAVHQFTTSQIPENLSSKYNIQPETAMRLSQQRRCGQTSSGLCSRVHPALVLRPSCVPEYAGVNKKRLNKKLYSCHKQGLT